jgi:hypothetical protein
MRALKHMFRISETTFACDTVTRRAEKDTLVHFRLVMPGLVPGIHVFRAPCEEVVDGRVKPGHDETPIVPSGTPGPHVALDSTNNGDQ